MFNLIRDILRSEGIDNVGMIPLSECEIINERILPKNAKSVIVFSIPYRSSKIPADDGFSEYARIYDYHKFASELYGRTIDLMKERTGFEFYGFCDHSPINEKMAIAKSGLGVIGRNSLFIDNKYGSFVFIGSILSDIECYKTDSVITGCINCQKCVTACPNGAIISKGIDRTKCLSAISQKKNKTDDEKQLLKNHNIVWGCDICQNVCPYNEQAATSPITRLLETRANKIDKEFIDSLSEEEFNKFAFSYKGRKIITDNLEFK